MFYGGNFSTPLRIRISGPSCGHAAPDRPNAGNLEMAPSFRVAVLWSSVDNMPVCVHNLVMDLRALPVDTVALMALAKKWKMSRLSAFGSVVRDDFRADSDVDLLVEFEPNVEYSLIDLASLKAQLERIFRRDVDIVEPAALSNPYRRKHILDTAQLLYAA